MEQQPGLPPAYVDYMDARERSATARADLARRRALQGAIDAERASVERLEADLVGERRDIDALTSIGFRSILARLRGRLDDELTAEQAEAEAIELEIATRRQALVDLEAATGGVGAITYEGQVRAADENLAAASQRWEAEQRNSASAAGRRLADLDANHTYLWARLREVDEASHAAAEAMRALGEAERELGRAAGWSTYDTFFGGGVLSSMVKHDRIDGAATAIADTQRALLRLQAELADLREPGPPVADLPSPALRAADVWFDNVFSDWMVHSRIKASQQSVAASLNSVRETAAGLAAHRHDIEAELRALATEREALLLEPSGST